MVQNGWNFDNVHFAMRETSKRPAMAFVFFTRMGDPSELQSRPTTHALPLPAHDPYQRLRELAEGGDE
ncbi:MAG: hypothetical protein IPJ65_16525 [Archangiaceae bacterium]|nr:hypothetical protein [Archangiaceae bacterium]